VERPSSTSASPARRSGSTSRAGKSESPARRPRVKKASQDATRDSANGGDSAALNPDPAVFEAAFVIDDAEGPSRVGTPMSSTNEKEIAGENDAAEGSKGNNESSGEGQIQEGDKPAIDVTTLTNEKKPDTTSHTTAVELPADVRAKLRKLEKLEATYPGRYIPNAWLCVCSLLLIVYKSC
jgi:hypothetical protein